MSRSRRTPQRTNRGFTLVELLAVVIITAVLSLLAVAGFQRHMASSRATEVVAVVQAIRSAEESYMAENKAYLNVSASKGVNWYPQLVPSTKRAAFNDKTHSDYLLWRQLAPPVNKTVLFSYLVNADVPGTIMLKPQEMTKVAARTTPEVVDWYLIQAKGDVNGNGTPSLYASSSTTGELYVENEGE